MARFRDRTDAGRQLAAALRAERTADAVVLALPRGGVPVAAEVAREWDAPLDVFISRKLGAPSQPEYGIGALAEGGEPMFTAAADALALDEAGRNELVARERDELERRVSAYRGAHPLPPLAGRTVVLVDDGLATGVTAEAALRALRTLRPGRLVLAVPVAAHDTAARLRTIADAVVTVIEPDDFAAVGAWYDDFEQTTDDEVLALLGRR